MWRLQTEQIPSNHQSPCACAVQMLGRHPSRRAQGDARGDAHLLHAHAAPPGGPRRSDGQLRRPSHRQRQNLLWLFRHHPRGRDIIPYQKPGLENSARTNLRTWFQDQVIARNGIEYIDSLVGCLTQYYVRVPWLMIDCFWEKTKSCFCNSVPALLHEPSTQCSVRRTLCTRFALDIRPKH